LPEEKGLGCSSVAPGLPKAQPPDFHALAQSLSGFNEALLMHKQTLLAVADPLGFPDAQEFTEEVRKAVGQSNSSAPQPHNDFHPIRTGILGFARFVWSIPSGACKILRKGSQGHGHRDHD
jgi:hypothetical protein